MSDFSSSFFVNNRKRLLQNVETKFIVVAANAELQRTGDSSFPFRQDSNFWYLTGIEEANFILVITPREEFLIKPNRHWVKDVFDGVVTDGSLSRASGITQILDSRKGWAKLTRLLNKDKKASTLFPMVDRHFGVTANPARRQLIQKMRRRVPALQVDDIRLIMARMRMVKQAPEIAAIKKAIAITNDTLKEVFVPEWYKKYKFEYEVEADIFAGFRKRGATALAFPILLASGKTACQIHPVDNDAPIVRKEMLLMDLGAEYQNYSSDISRTIPIGKKFSARQKQVFEAVQDVQNYAYSLLKPGVNIREYEQQIEEYMGETLKNLGVIKRLNRRNIRKYYPHATSHMMGLDTHDSADYGKVLEKSMILTVEPGIYLPNESIGIRIEDDVIVTKDGIQVLSDDLPVLLG